MQTLARIVFAAALLAACGPRPPAAVVDEAIATETGETFAFVAAPRFGDLKPHDWQGRTPASYPVHGIDISRYQSDIDWRRARASGVSFAYIKATEGGDRVDPKFDDHRKGAHRAGVRWGAYHFYYFCRPAEDQARWFIRNVPKGGNALPHVLDMEWNPFSPTCTLRPDGATVRREAERFLDMLEAHYGRRPIIYTTPDFFVQTGIGKLRGTEFWLRSVAGHPRETYDGRHWTFWQYTGTGVVPGVDGAVDINVFAGTPDAWRRWAN